MSDTKKKTDIWFPPDPATDWSAATRHLCRVEPVFRRIIKQVGPCTLAPRRDYFVVLCKSIISQQVSVAAAATMFGRLRDRFPQRRPTPKRMADFLTDADPELIRACGISRQKAKYLLDLARHFEDGRIVSSRLAKLPDEEVIAALTPVNGIGRWTAEMFLIFVLNRPDVLPVDDLGLRNGTRRAFHLATVPSAAELHKLAEPWRPYRSIATWYLWRQPGAVKQ